MYLVQLGGSISEFSDHDFRCLMSEVRVEFYSLGFLDMIVVLCESDWKAIQIDNQSPRGIIAHRKTTQVSVVCPFLRTSQLLFAVVEDHSRALNIEDSLGDLKRVVRFNRSIESVCQNSRCLCVFGEGVLELLSSSEDLPLIVSISLPGACYSLSNRFLATEELLANKTVPRNQRSIWQTGQRIFDRMVAEISADQEESDESIRIRIQEPREICFRDVTTGSITQILECHSEPLELLSFDTSGLVIVSSSGFGHKILVHMAVDDNFLNLRVLSRGVTPAKFIGVFISAWAEDVTVLSSNNTVHSFRQRGFINFWGTEEALISRKKASITRRSDNNVSVLIGERILAVVGSCELFVGDIDVNLAEGTIVQYETLPLISSSSYSEAERRKMVPNKDILCDEITSSSLFARMVLEDARFPGTKTSYRFVGCFTEEATAQKASSNLTNNSFCKTRIRRSDFTQAESSIDGFVSI